MSWADLESTLYPEPLFPVEAPDGRKDLPELDRQAWFVSYVRKTQPKIGVYANLNGGKRGPAAIKQAKREGMTPGVFDLTVYWDARDTRHTGPTVAWPEFKGYDARGRPGKLSPEQIEWGNAMHQRGFPVACFFSAQSVVKWLIELGAPFLSERNAR